jgi:hypothetical protein
MNSMLLDSGLRRNDGNKRHFQHEPLWLTADNARARAAAWLASSLTMVSLMLNTKPDVERAELTVSGGDSVRIGHIVLALVALCEPASPLGAQPVETGREFLRLCDRIDARCRQEFTAGLEAAYTLHLACPSRIDVNAPISGWIIAMHRLVDEHPDLLDKPAGQLQLRAMKTLWPCTGQ